MVHGSQFMHHSARLFLTYHQCAAVASDETVAPADRRLTHVLPAPSRMPQFRLSC